MTAPPVQSNVDTGGGDMIGVAVGGSHNRVTGSRTVVQGTGNEGPVTLERVMERLAELERAVEGADLSPELRQDALADVRTAREALSRPRPGVSRAQNALRGTAAELAGGGRTTAVTAVITLATAVIDMLGRLAG
jgi:hypothetical protein